MIVFVTGSIRAGKTYFVMQYISGAFLKDDEQKKKIPSFIHDDGLIDNKQRCLTNFKLRDDELDKLENVKKVKFKDLYRDIERLYEYSMKYEPTDEDLTNKAEEYEIANAIIALDEVQNYFAKDDKVLVWFLSYCGHMNISIFLVTQSFDLIHTKYKNICQEWFIKAIPQSLRLTKNMLYARYKTARLFSSEEFPNRYKVPINKYIFSLYEHGTVNKNKSQVFKVYMKAVFLFIFAIIAVLMVREYWKNKYITDDKKENQSTPQQKVSKPAPQQTYYQEPPQYIQEQSQSSNEFVVKMICNKKICYYNHTKYPYMYIKKIINIEDVTIIHKEKIELDYYVYFLLISNSFKNKYLNFTTGGIDETNSSNVRISDFTIF